VALATFLQLLRPQTLQDQRAQRLYGALAQDTAARLQHAFETWVELREIEPDYARLANAAAVNRWELMRLAREVEQFEVPRSLVSAHRNVLNRVLGAARACQLLANGYRFHKSEAICDGQAMLLDTVKDLGELVAGLQLRV
jgi:hypothetical protein